MRLKFRETRKEGGYELWEENSQEAEGDGGVSAVNDAGGKQLHSSIAKGVNQ